MISKRSSNKRKSFTLFEMLLVMAILAIALGASGIYIPKALKKETFEKGAGQLISKISLAMETMLDYQLDMKMVIEKDEEGKGFKVTLVPQQQTSSKLQQILNRHSLIKGIEEIAFNGERRKELILEFEARTGATTKGKLELFSQNQSSTVVLKGFVSKLQQGDYKENEIKAPYPEEILSVI